MFFRNEERLHFFRHPTLVLFGSCSSSGTSVDQVDNTLAESLGAELAPGGPPLHSCWRFTTTAKYGEGRRQYVSDRAAVCF